MNLTEEYKKEVLQCRSCGSVFHQQDVGRKQTEHLGHRNDTYCPYCGSTNFGLIDYPVDERELIYKDNRFFGFSNKRSRYIEMYEAMQEVINELYV